MRYNELTKEERKVKKKEIEFSIKSDLQNREFGNIIKFSSNEGTYIKKMFIWA